MIDGILFHSKAASNSESSKKMLKTTTVSSTIMNVFESVSFVAQLKKV